MLSTLHVVESIGDSSRGGTARGNTKRGAGHRVAQKSMLCRHTTPSLALTGPHRSPALFRGNGINSPESKSALRFQNGVRIDIFRSSCRKNAKDNRPRHPGVPPNACLCQFHPGTLMPFFMLKPNGMTQSENRRNWKLV